MNEQKILSHWRELIASIDELYQENNKILGKNYRLYTRLLEKFPYITLVDETARDEEALIQGVIQLFTDLESKFISSKAKKSKILAFTFTIDKAAVKEGWHNGPLLFSGTWLEVLEFILNEVIKIPPREDLSKTKQIVIARLIKELSESN